MNADRKEEMITVRLDQSLKAKMDEREEINWSGVARKAIRTTIKDLETMDEEAARNEMSEEEVQEIAESITESANTRATVASEETDTECDRA
jgi:Arc/MetJ-type ribon-helix-helix transcriptional regulator